jgi:predicted SAM-dependent methyltransferase
MNIEIGGGTLAPPGWTNLDPVHGTDGWKRRAQDGPWPAADGSVDEILASHVMEHIPAAEPRIFVMNEAHRVLRPGGVFTVRVPNAAQGWHAYADPTHVSFWVLESFHYFDGLKAAHADYGIRPWTTLELLIQGDNEILWRGSPR